MRSITTNIWLRIDVLLSALCRISALAVACPILISLLSKPAIAQVQPELTRAQLVGERPDAGSDATEVMVNVFVVDIDEVDEVEKRFRIDLFVNTAWTDPRLALPADQRTAQTRALPLDAIWTPRGLVVNDRGLNPRLPLVAEVNATGNVVYRQRYYGQLSAGMKFENFPFDTQRLPIEIISYQYSPNEVQFSHNGQILASPEKFSAEGWSFNLLDTEFSEFSVPEAGIVRPQMTVTIEAQRNYRYHLLTMYLPMSLIIFMAWTAFWIQPNVVPPRIAISTASIFSLMALGFSIRLSLPPVSYITRADMFVIGCTLLVFMALGIAVIGSRWAGADKMTQALQLNASMRWIYLVLFAVVAAGAAIV